MVWILLQIDDMTGRILIADDDAALREALGEALSVQGHDVRMVSDVDEALASIGREDFDVLLADVMMPGDGATLPLRLHPMASRPRVILMTGFDRPGVQTRAMADGAFGYLLKPIRLADLCAVVDLALSTPR